MYRIYSLLLLCLTAPFCLKSQVLPKEGSMLNYRMVGFSFPANDKAVKYTIEIAGGYYKTEDSFKKNIIVKQSVDKNKIIAEVPSFGSPYTWRVAYTDSKSAVTKSIFYHFNTLSCPGVDTNTTRLRILHAAERNKDGFVFLNSGVLYDMAGHPVWFLPASFGANPQPVDIKLSPKGTITFLLNDSAYEINYNGTVLWKAPDNGAVSGAATEGYHHEFTRLNNGHYMVLGNEDANMLRELPPAGNRSSFIVSNDKLKGDGRDTVYEKVAFGTIIEYDEKGDVVWSWKSSAYFNDADLYYRVLNDRNSTHEMHENGFFFDEKNQVVYVSFRVPSRVIKIRYPDGKLLATYGKLSLPGIAESGNSLFYGQHACRISEKGYLYLYNNNVCDSGCIPKITMMKEPANDQENLKVIWEYNCTTADMAWDHEIMKNKLIFRSGGNVSEMPDNSMFVSMAQPYSELFIVNQDKQIVWSALPEHLDPGQTKWQITSQYRASIIDTRDEMEHLVWGDGTGK